MASEGSELRYSTSPPSGWHNRCTVAGNLFHSSEWAGVLQKGFGSRPLYVWGSDDDIAFLISVFHVGPFRVGYLGFPTGGTLGYSLRPSHVGELHRAGLPLDILRIPVSAFGPQLDSDMAYLTTPETAVSDLGVWDLAALPKLRRALKRSGRKCFQYADLDNESAGADLFRLYRDTINKHSGSVRYTPAYFKALLGLASRSPNLRCLGALHEGELAGFVVVALSSRTGFYLHGATAGPWSSYHISDVLIYNLLEWARVQGMDCFNLMSSPPAQTGLVGFKEKFGGNTRPHCLYELPVHPVRAGLFRSLLRIHQGYIRLHQGGA